MDTTETYIKMSDCEEIQGQYQPKDGDWFVAASCVYVRTDLDPMTNRAHLNKLFVWLPRQDQLQEMMRFEADRYGGVQIEPVQLLNRFGVFCEKLLQDKNHTEKFQTSMEQLWLAFVMKEKYNKVWNGEEWAERL